MTRTLAVPYTFRSGSTTPPSSLDIMDDVPTAWPMGATIQNPELVQAPEGLKGSNSEREGVE